MVREIFVIQHVGTGMWCNSGRHCSFAPDFNDASLFHKWENAEKVLKEIIKHATAGQTMYMGKQYVATDDKDVFEIITCLLTPV